MITVLCANAGVDKTYEVENFAVGGFYHPRRTITAPGGKGINVARVLKTLGQPVVVTGFAGGNNGRFLTQHLRSSGIQADFVPIGEESRVVISIIDGAQGTQTRVDEVGPLVTPSEVDRLRRKWDRLLDRSDLAVIAGSAPRGVSLDLYGELVETARKKKAPLILDAHDELLARALSARPVVIKPNLSELQRLVNGQLSVPDGVVEAGKQLVGDGINVVVTSLGARGAIAVTDKHGIWWARPPKVKVVNSVGSGDALVAGFAAASMERKPFDERLRLAVAAGTANAATFGAGACSEQEISKLLPEVKLKRLDAVEQAESAEQ